ncbi:MAG: hypothetical protein HKM95_00345 [Inquilinus sp.]|nr:hypothetical protein [Inquilinus sp.]
MTVHRYPLASQRADLLRGGIGLLLTGLPLLMLKMHWLVLLLFAAAALLFALFVGRVALRALTVYETGDTGIVARGPLGGAIAWDDLAALKLHFFSTRRDRREGWMLLTLKGGGRTLKLESTLEGFETIVDHAAEIAKARQLPLGRSTTNNLLAMGAPVAEPDGAIAAGGRP